MGWKTQLCRWGLGLLILVAYANTFHVPFLYDDHNAIVENPQVRRLWPPWEPLQAPGQSTVAGRPGVSLSLALNYAVSGLDPWSYHVVNLAFHIGAALVVYAM